PCPPPPPHSPPFPYTTLFRSTPIGAKTDLAPVPVVAAAHAVGALRRIAIEEFAVDAKRGVARGRAVTQRVVALVVANSSIAMRRDRKSTRLNSSHQIISYAVF